MNSFFETIDTDVYFENAYFTNSYFSRFSPDQCFRQHEEHFYCFSGTFLNRQALLNKYQCRDNDALIHALHMKHGMNFVELIRGDFSGFVFNEKEHSISIFTGFFNEKPVFYLHDKANERLIFASAFYDLVQGARKMGRPLTLSEKGCYYLLTFGQMLGDETLFEEIKKMPPASVLTFRDNKLSFHQYYSLNNAEPVDMSKKKIIAELDQRFTQAIKAEYDKDVELGLKHLASLSGGLDSRVNVLTARKSGYKDIHTLTFSQPGYLDDTISRKIAEKFNLPRHFISLDQGEYLMDFMSPTMANGGLTAYFNAAIAFYVSGKLDFSEYGILHTGQLGDGILGKYVAKPYPEIPEARHLFKYGYSPELVKKIPDEDIRQITGKYRTAELLRFYEHGLNNVFNGNIMIHQYAEQSSPFLHVDFIDFAVRIPEKFRHREFLYIEWINKYMKEAGRFTWEKFKVRPAPLLFNKYAYFIPRTIKAGFAGLFKYGILPKYHMNPHQYWASHNIGLKNQIEGFINDNIHLVKKYHGLSNDIRDLTGQNSFILQGRIITLLAALKKYQDNTNDSIGK